MRGMLRLSAAIAAVGVSSLVGTAAAAHAADVTAQVSNHRLLVVGRDGDARITLRLRPGHRSQLVVDADGDGDGDFRFDRARFDVIRVNGRAGDDVVRIDERYGVFTTVERTTILGGRGADSLVGGSASETLVGGDGADSVVGGPGPDLVSLGAGDDLFRTAPGSGSDVLAGEDGSDTLRVLGSPAGDTVALAADGVRLRLVRNGNARAVRANGVERVDLRGVGGSDRLTVNDLSGTAVTSLDVDLGPADGGVNALIVNGTNGDDVAVVSGNASGVAVSGLAAQVAVTPGAATDTLRVNVLAGDDVVDASSLAAGALLLTLDGGDGADVLIGSAGPDTEFGGPGDDVLLGGPGLDVLDGGPGDNVVIQD